MKFFGMIKQCIQKKGVRFSLKTEHKAYEKEAFLWTN